MQAALHLVGHGAVGCLLARSGGRTAPGVATPTRGCQLGCGASAHAPLKQRLGRSQRRLGRREAVVCHAAAKNFYEILGLSQSASDRDIKSSYRKLAMKLHPDVNRAPDAQKRFMEVKVAYETLSDNKQRAEYDRWLRMGFGGGGRAGAGSSSYGSSSSYNANRGAYGSGPNYTQEPLPNLDELVRELEKEFTAWANSRGKGGKAKSLIDELEDLGGELLDFLEDALGIKDEPPAASSSSSNSRSSSGQRGDATGAGAAREPRTAAEKYDQFWQQYGDGSPAAATGGSAASGSSARSSGSSGAAGSRAGAGSAGPSSTSSSSSSGQRQAAPPPPRSADDDIEAQLQALKKKLNKL